MKKLSITLNPNLLGSMILRDKITASSKKFLDDALIGTVSILLVLVGISIGKNASMLTISGQMGWEALVLALSGMIGSIISSLVCQYFLLKSPSQPPLPKTSMAFSSTDKNKLGTGGTTCLLIGSILTGFLISYGEIILFPSPLIAKLTSITLMVLFGVITLKLGLDGQIWGEFKMKRGWLFFILPVSTLIGTLLATGVVSNFLPGIQVSEGMAVGSGLGFYSATTAITSAMSGPTLGVIAFLANLTREIMTLILTPTIAKYLGPLAPIALGGATSVNSTFPIISKSVGPEFSFLAIVNGGFLTLVAPFIVTGLLYLGTLFS